MSPAVVLTVCALVVSAAAAQDASVASPPVEPAPAPAPASGTGASDGARAHTKATTRSRPHATRRRTHAPPAAHRAPESGDGSSLSVGRHNRGRLIRGHELHESDALRFKSRSEARFGTDELVALLDRAARAVMARTPGARLTVGDLSRRGGGRFRPHRSHQSGRDVDLGFYVTDPDGAPLDLHRFYDFRRDLTVRGHDELRYDLVRNWQLVEALVMDEVPVQWIFVSRTIRGRLLEEGARQGASADVIARAEAILSQPSHGGMHNDQFHVRIYCPLPDRPRCVDDPPIHPWMPGAPARPEAPPAEAD